jgi:2-polyprenyl-6-methoxyphenol hydroxylase-like FAD-dependent oxidoreductase
MRKSSANLGKRAIVLGAGIGGTLAARALADHFTQVTVLERDGAPDADGFRKGTPQAKLVHGLLRGGLDAMNALFPGLEQELYAGGAVRSKPMRDQVFFDQPGDRLRHNLGFDIPLLSRPLLERTLRAALARVLNVEVRERTLVRELIYEGGQIRGVVCKNSEGEAARELADLVVDASGRAAHAGEWLAALGLPLPVQTRVEVDIMYAACFVRPPEASDLLSALVIEAPPAGRYCGLVMAQEGGRIMAGVASRGRDVQLPDDFAGVLALAQRLPHPAAFDLLRAAEPLTPLTRFSFPASVQRHYPRMHRVPEGFLCVGDAICTFNPIWGQGMSVAALEVLALQRLLEERAAQGGSLLGVPAAFYAEAARIVAPAWQLSVGPDFGYETTRGDKPPEFEASRGFSRALSKLAQRDPEVRSLLNDVYHLVTPMDALRAPALVAKVLPLIEAS